MIVILETELLRFKLLNLNFKKKHMKYKGADGLEWKNDEKM